MARYSSNLKSMPLLLNEMRKAALLKIDVLDDKVIAHKSQIENIFQVATKKRQRELANKILTRLRTLSPELLTALACGSIEEAKVVTLYALLNEDLLLFEFFQEVYSYKYITGNHFIYDSDIMLYFQRKAEVSAIVANWKDNNIRQLRNAYKKVLLESGFAKRHTSCLEITPPFVEKEVRDLLAEEKRQAMCL